MSSTVDARAHHAVPLSGRLPVALSDDRRRAAATSKVAALALIAGILPISVTAQRGVVAVAPTIQLDVGMHDVFVSAIATDRDNRFIATSSWDNTVRVWDLPTGRLLRVLRPPVDNWNTAKLYAVAMSPDGRHVATSGWTSADGFRNDVFVFDRQSGRIVAHARDLPNVVEALAYSFDGRALGAVLGGNAGLRVFEATNYTPIFTDTEYGDTTFGLAWDRLGRTATASNDGFVRFYEPTSDQRRFRLTHKSRIRGGQRPQHVAFAPDGRLMLVGFSDSTTVRVVSGRDLSEVFELDVSGVDIGGGLSVAEWSVDGNTIIGAGRYAPNHRPVVRLWSQGGRGPWRDVPISQSTVTQVVPTRDGGFIYSAADPAFGRMDLHGTQRLQVAATNARFGELFDDLEISADASRVQFHFEPLRQTVTFSVKDRTLQPASANPSADPVRPSLRSGLPIADWHDDVALAGRRLLTTESGNVSRSLAISLDGTHFLLGSQYGLLLFDKDGHVIWETLTQAPVFSVNLSDDGRLAVGALGDGTIRWYRIESNGPVEILALFAHPDARRWILWTPSGYYDCSPGAEDFVGWYVSNGRDAAADLYPLSRYRRLFYRPDVVAHVLETGDPSSALALADREAGRKIETVDIATQRPPTVEIVAPLDGSSTSNSHMTIRYRTRVAAGEAVTGIKAYVDGSPVPVPRNLRAEQTDGSEQQLVVDVPAHDADLTLIAENRYGASVPATVHLAWVGAIAANKADVFKPTLYVLAVGVSSYANSDYNLKFAAKDATDFAAALQRQQGGLYNNVQVRLLTDSQATRDGVTDGLDWLLHAVEGHDIGIVFFAGHGVNDNVGGYYFLPHNGNPARLLTTGVGQSDIRNIVGRFPGKAMLVFIDTCHSGNALGTSTPRAVGAAIDGFVNDLIAAQRGIVVFTASAGSQYSYEDPAWGNGAFTKAVVEGLNGRADLLHNGSVTIKGLDYYVADRVKQLTGGKQSPRTFSPEGISESPIAVVQ